MNRRILGLALLALCACDDHHRSGADGPNAPANDPEIEASLVAQCERAGGRPDHRRPRRALPHCSRGRAGECQLEEADTVVQCALPRAAPMCGDSVSAQELLLLLNGAVVAVGHQLEDGVSAYEIFANVVIGMLYNGIDWNELDDLDLEFDPSDGSYVLTSGASRVGFRLTWARDFAGHRAGDPITDSVFDLDSYVRGIDVDVGGSIMNPRVDYDFETGPLFDLIDGDVDIEGRDPRTLRVRLGLHVDAVAVELLSVGRRRFEAEAPGLLGAVHARYDYETRITSNPIPLDEAKARLEGDGFAIDLAGTTFEREYSVLGEPIYRTRDTFERSNFVILDGEEGAHFEGFYRGVHAVEARVLGRVFSGALYHTGFMSTRAQNTTTFYCDAARTDLWGTAAHDLDLRGGRFVFSSGERVRYGLNGLEWEEDQVDDSPGAWAP